MNGYVTQRRGRFYAVIYESRDPVTDKGCLTKPRPKPKQSPADKKDAKTNTVEGRRNTRRNTG